MFFNYTQNIDQYLSILFSILLILGSYFLGKKIFSNFFPDFRMDSIFLKFYNVLIGNIILNFFIQYLILFDLAKAFYIKWVGIGFILYTLFLLIKGRQNFVKCVYNYYLKVFNSSGSVKLLLFLLLGFSFVSLAPVTNADSLNYHIGVPLSILREGGFVWQPTWFHQGLSGLGENSILLAVVIKAEQFPAFLQIAAIFSIVGLFFYEVKTSNCKPKGYSILLILLFISSPVLLFLTSSYKPQLVGIALSSFLFVNFVLRKVNFTFSNIFFMFFIISYIMGVKLSFVFSSLTLILAFLFENRAFVLNLSKMDIIKYFLIFLISLIFFFIPIFYNKLLNSNFDFTSFFYPIPIHYPGQKLFLEYLKNYKEVNLYFPFSLIIPSSFGVYSLVLGINLLIAFYLLIKNKVSNIFLVYITFLCVCIYFFGQLTARFYFEPFIWLLLLINFHSNKYYVSNFLKSFVSFLSLLQICILFFGFYFLSSGVVSMTHRDRVLSSSANGYMLSKWVNSLLPDSARLLSEHRSVALFNQIVYSADWSNFVDFKKNQDKFYVNYLVKENVKYILILGDKQEDSKLFTYCDSLISGPFMGKVSTRNPVNSGSRFKAWLYTSKFK